MNSPKKKQKKIYKYNVGDVFREQFTDRRYVLARKYKRSFLLSDIKTGHGYRETYTHFDIFYIKDEEYMLQVEFDKDLKDLLK